MSEEERKRAREEAQKTAVLELEEELRQPVKRKKYVFWLTLKEYLAVREFLYRYRYKPEQ
jgi:hypothetical protein